MKAPLALEGARISDGTVIRRAKLRGVESAGMLCSARELGLSEEHEGILELPDELVTGTPLRDALALDDTILTLNVTPNRGDVLSVLGVAREVAAITGRKLVPPPMEAVQPATRERFAVRLEAPAGCPRFAGRVIHGVNAAARTPLWMRERLRRAGLRPIRPVVDVTNYVMLELGQPLHAYDLRRLRSHIEVRLARAGEKLKLLDGRDVEPGLDTLVIADAAGPVGLAGRHGRREERHRSRHLGRVPGRRLFPAGHGRRRRAPLRPRDGRRAALRARRRPARAGARDRARDGASRGDRRGRPGRRS
jgi:phenylalanyl-tRNA synthetase beta chain